MVKLVINIEDRNYNLWCIKSGESNLEIDEAGLEELKTKINPVKQKLFHRDIIEYNNDEIKVLGSPIREKEIAGILMLEKNRTFGRSSNKKRLLYKCVPDDRRIPCFLIPYEIEMKFTKVFKNKYVVFRFEHWNEKHPYGILSQTLGDVDNLQVFYEYQLYCRELHMSIIKFIKRIKETLGDSQQNEEYIMQVSKNPKFDIKDTRETEPFIFTVDPEGCVDMDDGFSIKQVNGGYTVNVYIANVFVWLETFNLWDYFSDRVSTIYLPNKKVSMMPNTLSECLCSLEENKSRFAFKMSVFVDDNGVIDKSKTLFTNELIRVSKNYHYEDPYLNNQDLHYKMLFNISKVMDNNIQDSHDVVSHWMIIMNMICGEYMASNRFGVFRTSLYADKNKTTTIIPNLSANAKQVIVNWNNISGKYILYNTTSEIKHEAMELQYYVHITSPIRRIVDLINQMSMMLHLKLAHNISENTTKFLDKWLSNIDFINDSTKNIRKVQTDCDVMYRCFTDPNIMSKEYSGILFHKEYYENMYYYMVYLEEIKILTRIKTNVEIENYSYKTFKLYLFEDEYKLKKKIRIMLIE